MQGPVTHGAAPEALWRPDAPRIARARISRYTAWLQETQGLRFDSYDALWEWSTTDLPAFWTSIWGFFGTVGNLAPGPVLPDRRMPGAKWFPGTTLNYVDQVFRHRSAARPAIVAGSEDGALVEVAWAELERKVAAFADTLRARGVARGDRVAAFLPNTPDAIVAFLGCASVGAIWSLCSPDMGVDSVLDRFRQIAPKVLIATDGYRYGGKAFDRREVVAGLRKALPSVKTFVRVPSSAVPDTAHDALGEAAVSWRDATTGEHALVTEPVPFDHPLWIVYSSGTTGLPKPIVHGHGGTALEGMKLLALHGDLGPDDRYHWYTSTGWIMWNLQVAGLLVGSTICIYDGSPGFPDLGALWRFADAAGVTFLGSGAAFYANCMKAGISPRAHGNLQGLRSIGSTGSPLSSDAYAWLQHEFPDAWIDPISGGTDIASAFVGGVCTLPVYAGEMQCRCLGARVEAWDESGRPVIGAVGELVCTTPLPSMPLHFWNDEGDRRYRDSYFDVYPGVWRHGDWIEITPRGGAIIYGRSDATINRHGIRMGTSELYRAVEALPEVLDSLVVDLEYLGRPSSMQLFVVLREGVTLDADLDARLRQAIRTALTPRHVPDAVHAVPAVPRTLSGKKLEVPIKRLLLGEPAAKLLNPDALANPESLAWYVDFAARHTARTAAT